MEDQSCPRCKTTRYRNPTIKFMVNVCGHTLCESCMELLFAKGSGNCPECMTPLRKVNFRTQTYEDAMVEKEIEIRKRILRDYNMKEDDFPTPEAYNAYLEEIETIIHNLNNNINTLETNKRIEQYKRDNRDYIMRNKLRLGHDEYELEDMLEKERAEREARHREIEKYEAALKARKMFEKEVLINELMSSKADPKQIVNDFNKRLNKLEEELKSVPPPKPFTEFSTGIKFTTTTSGPKAKKVELIEGPLFVYEPYEIEWFGPKVPSMNDLNEVGYLSHIRTATPMERAGGFEMIHACMKALQEAKQGLTMPL